MNESDNNQKKVKEIVDLMSKFTEDNPLAQPIRKNHLLDQEPDPEFTVVETTRTITYSQKDWKSYGKLVRYSQ